MAGRIKKLDVCEHHIKSFGEIHAKLDDITERQIDYIQHQSEMKAKVSNIEKIVTNGLGKTVSDLSETAIALQQKTLIVDDVAWFLDMVKGFKNELPKKVIKWAFIGGGIAVGYTFIIAMGNRLSPKLVSFIFG